jgi:hypothetical protein
MSLSILRPLYRVLGYLYDVLVKRVVFRTVRVGLEKPVSPCAEFHLVYVTSRG